jgi:putative DNA primase/helicase
VQPAVNDSVFDPVSVANAHVAAPATPGAVSTGPVLEVPRGAGGNAGGNTGGNAGKRSCAVPVGLDGFLYTDMGNVERVKRVLGGNARFIPETGVWLFWKDGHWQEDNSKGGVTKAIKVMTDCMFAVASEFREKHGEHDEFSFSSDSKNDPTKKLKLWACQSQNKGRIDAVIALLEQNPAVRLNKARLDADPYLVGLNQARGVLDLRTGLVRAAQREDFITKSLRVKTVGQAEKAHRWLQFLNEVFDGNQELIGYMQRWCGYALTGATTEQCLQF